MSGRGGLGRDGAGRGGEGEMLLRNKEKGSGEKVLLPLGCHTH